jgi:glycosyltransferase involved in cell wall biosynthesis
MIKISLIIPVYNVEQYLEKCLTSCIKQDIPLEEYEIIIINDGAKDNSLSIAERFEKEYKNITVYSQENQGLSAARNKGLSLAKGEYVWFIDSDDWIQNHCLSKILTHIENKDIDVIAMGYIKAFDNSKENYSVDYHNKEINNGKTLLTSDFYTPAQLYIYRKKFLENNSLFFYVGIFHEDSEFTPRMLYYASKIKILEEPIYYFYKRPNSITTSVNPKKAFDLIKVCNSLSEFSTSILPEYKIKFDNIISTNINSALYNSFEMNSGDKDKLNNIIYENRHLFIHLKKSNILKYKIEGFIFNLLPKKTVHVYQFLQMFNKEKTVSKI